MKRTVVAAGVLVLAGLASATPADAATSLASTSAVASASAGDEGDDVVFDDDGNVIEGDDEIGQVLWEEENPTTPPPGVPEEPDFPGVPGKPTKPIDNNEDPQSCPEINKKATVSLTKSRKFIIDKKDPWSTWLLPNQTIEYTTESSHEFSVQVTVGGSAQAGVFLAKVATKLDIQVGYKYTSKSGRKIADTNKTKKGYRVRLGNSGYHIVEKRTYFVPPCKRKTVVTQDMVAPEVGDLSFGRFNS